MINSHASEENGFEFGPSFHSKLKSYEHIRKKKKKKPRQPTKWEKILANDKTNKGLISPIYKQLIHQLNNNSTLKSQQSS